MSLSRSWSPFLKLEQILISEYSQCRFQATVPPKFKGFPNDEI